MNRTIFAGSLASVLFLLVGTYLFPNSLIMWLASTSLPYTLLRCVMVIGLLTVLFTSPPRKLVVRAGMAGLAVVMFGWGLALSFGNSVHILDIVLFMELSFAFGLEALELNEEELDQRVLHLQHPDRYPEEVRTLGAIVVQQWQTLRSRNLIDWQVV